MRPRLKLLYIVVLVVLIVVFVGYSPLRAGVSRIVSGTTARFYSNVSQNSRAGTFNNGLVGLWSFNGPDTTTTSTASGVAVLDRSGQSNDGSLQNGTVFNPGLIGQSVRFDGADDYIDVGSGASFHNFSQPATVSAWVKTSGDTCQTIWSFNDGSADQDNILAIFIGNACTGLLTNELVTASRISDANTTYILGYTTATRTELVDNQWHHVALTFDGSAVAIYIDGSSRTVTVGAGLNNGSYGGLTTVTELSIGARDSGNPGAFFNGALDELRIYNRALSAAEIAVLYRAGAPEFRSKTNVSQNSRLNNGLVGLWSFNGPDISGTTATDRSGFGNNGTLTSGPTVTSGMVGQALNFDGSNDYVSVGDSAVFTPSGSGASISVSAWVRLESLPSSGSSYGIVAKDDFGTPADRSWSIVVLSAGGIQWLVSQVSDGATRMLISPTTNTLTLGAWTHIVSVYNGSDDTGYVYFNGVQDATTNTTALTGIFDSAIPVRIGAIDNSGVARFFDGQIDEVRIYNRALSAAEIIELYNAGRR